jgi:DNA adenine methylase
MNINFIGYVGGKFYLKEKIYSILPNHTIFVEVFGGAANVLLNKPPSKVEVYNDLNKDLTNLFYVLSFHYDEFYKKVKFLIYSREIFNVIKKEIENTKIQSIPDVDRAVKVFYLHNTSFSGTGTSFAYGLAKSRAVIYNRKIKKLESISKRLKDVLIEALDFEEVIKKYDTKDTLFFLDPPYFGTEFYYSTSDLFFEYEDHLRLLQLVKNIKGKFILTTYENELYSTELKDFNLITFDVVKYSTATTKLTANKKKLRAKEFVYFNFDLQQDLFKDNLTKTKKFF